jgi:NADH-quinone oxidoreductase subunit L
LAGFLLLALAGRRLSRRGVATVATGSVLLAGLATSLAAVAYLGQPAREGWRLALWPWIEVGALRGEVALRLDGLSLVMALVVTVVGFLIHLYATESMEEEPGYARFFAYLNLFVGAMLVLVLADDLLLLYLGWEGVGLCSFLLIGFWYRDPETVRAARKAFVVTRVGDAAMAVGLLLLATGLGTLRLTELGPAAEATWGAGSAAVLLAAALLLAGAVGKSAQLPLQVWLPDAMAGPTPVSALIHAATMVTAGVYLLARTHALFLLAPPVMTAVALIGAATLLLAGGSALFQHDVKRVLAYSTISQLGTMFLALGVGAFSAAIFHLLTHAVFKALLFLVAGVVIDAFHHEHDLRRMGGLRHSRPLLFALALIGAGALAGVPLLTAGFFSKDAILWRAWGAGPAGPWLWGAGILGAFLTAVYIFRWLALAFLGPAPAEPGRRPGGRILAPLLVLAALSLLAGWLETPALLGGVHLLSDVLGPALPPTGHEGGSHALDAGLMAVAALAALGGIAVALAGAHRRRTAEEEGAIARLLAAGWGFDRVYAALFVRPLARLAEAVGREPVDRLWNAVAALARAASTLLAPSQSGQLRRYAALIAAGAALLLAWGILR